MANPKSRLGKGLAGLIAGGSGKPASTAKKKVAKKVSVKKTDSVSDAPAKKT
ncbi:MAG: chromosome partitioning protein ParB, partial [Opitutales bacterium]|nr:chromosome partitioning protein ParB [Opitutales bacterium]